MLWKPLKIVNCGRLNWIRSHGFFFTLERFFTYKFWCLTCRLFDLFLSIGGELIFDVRLTI
jgi:hypothetical protein